MDNELFVQNIKKHCFEKGELPTNACRNAGVGTSFISDLNRGRVPSVEKVQKLADYLGVTTSELLGETLRAGPGDKKEPATVSGDGQADKLAKALFDIGIDVDKLSETEISRIARLAKAALEE